MKTKPLDDLEMFKLLQAAYPEKFPDDTYMTFEEALNFAADLNGFDELADLLGRVVNVIALHEREACALICDRYSEQSSNPMNFASNCADTIRRGCGANSIHANRIFSQKHTSRLTQYQPASNEKRTL